MKAGVIPVECARRRVDAVGQRAEAPRAVGDARRPRGDARACRPPTCSSPPLVGRHRIGAARHSARVVRRGAARCAAARMACEAHGSNGAARDGVRLRARRRPRARPLLLSQARRPSSRTRARARRAPTSAAGCSRPAPRSRSGCRSTRARRSAVPAASGSKSPPIGEIRVSGRVIEIGRGTIGF